MRVGQDFHPKSSFLSVEKDYNLIFKKILNNQRLLKLLYYSSSDCLKAADLTNSQIQSMLGKQLKIVPKDDLDLNICPIFLLVSMTDFTPNPLNPEFRDCTLEFSICCNFDNWNLENFQLRPYKIAGELDAMFEKQKLTGIGETIFITASNWLFSSEAGGLVLKYWLVHGSDDQIP